jgi:hypothetical protein
MPLRDPPWWRPLTRSQIRSWRNRDRALLRAQLAAIVNDAAHAGDWTEVPDPDLDALAAYGPWAIGRGGTGRFPRVRKEPD